MFGIVLGDWIVDIGGFGYGGVVIIFGVLLVVIVVLYLWIVIDCVLLFWVVFILICLFGVVVGDFFDKLFDYGGFVFSCLYVLGVLVVVIVVLVLIWLFYLLGCCMV